jgi:hypothetical protein
MRGKRVGHSDAPGMDRGSCHRAHSGMIGARMGRGAWACFALQAHLALLADARMQH